MAKEYILREAAERILYDGCHTTDGREVLDDVVELWHMIQNLPAADVRPVVYCKDCKHRFNYDICAYRGDNWFCGYGERRTDNG